MKSLKNNHGCYIVNVPGEAHTFASEKDRLFYKNTFGGIENIGHSRYIGFEFKILGEISADHICFDVEPFVDKVDGTYINYTDETKVFLTPKSAFYSLLAASGVYFKNPYGYKPPFEHETFRSRDQYMDAQSKLTQKSILIKKV